MQSFFSSSFLSGHYMYIESSYPRKQNDTARLISPVYKATHGEHCLQFYYNMYGADVGALNVKVIRKSNFYPDFSTIHPADTPILKYLQVKLIRFTVFFFSTCGLH